MNLNAYAEALNLLGDPNRLRLCALLAERELCVSDLVRVTGITQSRVSTHLARMRSAGLLRHRRSGTQAFYGLAKEGLSTTVRGLVHEVIESTDQALLADRERLAALDAERRGGLPEAAVLELDRDYSPGRTWQSLTLGAASLLRLGDVLDVGCGDGTVSSVLAPRCRTLTCIDVDPRAVRAAHERLADYPNVEATLGDVHALPFPDASFDDVLLFHTLTFADEPSQALAECWRVLRPKGRVVLLCVDRHDPTQLDPAYGLRHPGFTPEELVSMLGDAGYCELRARVVCRESRKPQLQVVLAEAQKTDPAKPRIGARPHAK